MSKNNEPLSNNLIFIQNWLRPALTPVLHNKDHRRLVDDLEKLNQSLETLKTASKDYEHNHRSSETMIYIAMIQLMTKRLA